MRKTINDLAGLGAALRERREELGLTQDRLATLAGLSRATVNELENGLVADLGLAKVIRLLDLVGFGLEATQKRVSKGLPALGGLKVAAKTASVSYRKELPPSELALAIRTGRIPEEYCAHFATLLDEAPIPIVIHAVEESFAGSVPRQAWRHIAKWAADFQSPRNVWR